MSTVYKAGELYGGKRCAWVPQPRQAEFMRRYEDEVLFGGAAGGGKSDALVIEALRQIKIPHYKGLILRKTYPQLRELIEKSFRYYPLLDPKAKYNASEHTWRFSTGAKIIFGSMQHDKNKYDYQGQAYDYIAFDELTHFTWDEYSYLMSRNRPNGPGTRCYMRASANPGGLGHAWVKERFITPMPPMQTLKQEIDIMTPNGRKITRYMTRVFVPSKLTDNKELMQNDPNYMVRLASMPEEQRRALLYGDWDAYVGQVFGEWKNDPDHYRDRRFTHVIEPFEPPEEWRYYRSFDWGYAKPFSCGWWAVDREGIAYRIHEYYGCKKGEPDKGLQMPASEVFAEIARAEREHPFLKRRQFIGVADPAIWDRQTGESTADVAAKHGIYFTKGDNKRIAGWVQMHERLHFDERGVPRMYIFNTCKDFIRTFPALQYDEHKVEDVDTSMEDHCLVGETMIQTAYGLRRIEDLVGTEGLVLSHDGTYRKYSDVRMTRKKADVYRVELEDGTMFEGTADHRIMTDDGAWIRIGEMIPGETELKICEST